MRTWAWTAWTSVVVSVLALHIASPRPGVQFDAPYWPWALGLMAFPVAAALILARRRRNGVGAALGVVATASLLIFGPHWYAASWPDSPLTRPAELLAGVAVLPQFGGMVALLHLFPTGRPLGAWHRRVLALFVSLMTGAAVLFLLTPGPLWLTGRPNPIGILPAWTRPLGEGWFLIVAVFALLGIASLVLRWRQARPVERAQLRWFLAGAVVMLVTIASLDSLPEPEHALAGVLWGVFLAVGAFWSLPAAVMIAVTRHRLYEIDRLISRTVSYALVVATLVGVYAGGVLLVGFLLPLQGELAVAAATLAVAALFNPLRRRVQRRVDRRFNRARYDAARVVERFTARLRDEVDLDDLAGDLLAVAAAAVQPAGASLWLRGDHR